MRSTIRPTSRRTACTITRATWRWCARASRKFRSCCHRRRRRSKPRSMRGAGAIAACHLPERFGGQHLPADRGDRPESAKARRAGVSSRRAWREAVQTALERGEQALLFLNRRGYAPLTLCRACGFRFACPNCDAWLVDHRFKRRLVCHHCGFSMPPPEACPKCASDRYACRRSARASSGWPRRSRRCFPASAASCCPAISWNRSSGCAHELDDVAQGQFDIIIGTQLVAKGHHFPKLNLVGIVDADLGLANGDPRAAERTFQLAASGRRPRRPRGRARASASCRRISPSIR